MLFKFLPHFLLALSAATGCAGRAVSLVERQSPAGDPIVVDAGGVYMRATTLSDGSILGGYAASDGANRVLRAVKSTDGGASWTQLGVVSSGPAATMDIDNAYPLQLASGRVLFAFRNHDKASGGGYTFYRITLCASEDGGATWSFLTQIDERAAGSDKNGLWEPFLRENGGIVQAYYSSENNSPDQDNLMKTSSDNGATWSGAITVSGGGITSRDGMMGVAEVDGPNNLICVFENTENGTPFSIDYVLSQDGGASWNTRTRLYTAANGKEAGAPQVINVGGTLVTSFMTTEGGGGPGVDGGEFKVVRSTDGGKSWSGATVIGGLGSHWPGLYTLDSSSFLALYAIDGSGLVSQKYTV